MRAMIVGLLALVATLAGCGSGEDRKEIEKKQKAAQVLFDVFERPKLAAAGRKAELDLAEKINKVDLARASTQNEIAAANADHVANLKELQAQDLRGFNLDTAKEVLKKLGAGESGREIQAYRDDRAKLAAMKVKENAFELEEAERARAKQATALAVIELESHAKFEKLLRDRQKIERQAAGEQLEYERAVAERRARLGWPPGVTPSK